MDVLKNKQYMTTDYICRYTHRPYYYNTVDKKEIFGIGSNMNKNTAWVAHKVEQEDTLDSLALAYYNNPTFWWVIAYFNDILYPLDDIKLIDHYSILKIPSIASIEFGADR